MLLLVALKSVEAIQCVEGMPSLSIPAQGDLLRINLSVFHTDLGVSPIRFWFMVLSKVVGIYQMVAKGALDRYPRRVSYCFVPAEERVGAK